MVPTTFFVLPNVLAQNEDKIRYAKWKAADISKALREGRRPTPGPAGQIEDPVSFEQPEVSSPPNLNKSMVQHATQADHDIGYGSPTEGVNVSRGEGNKSSTYSAGIETAWENISPSSSPRPSAMKASEREGSLELEHNDRTQFSSASKFSPFLELAPKALNQVEVYQGPLSIYAPSPRISSSPSISSPTSPCVNLYAYPDETANSYPPPKSSVPSATALAPPSSTELAPELIAKVQKHCRFAISSLDYEDAEQAKKELRTALALLGDL